MTRFTLEMARIKMVCPEDQRMLGMVGTVHRILVLEGGAWVRFDNDIPYDLRSFPADDARCRDLMVWPYECDLLEALS